jgi:methionyl-tRNA formyltransferase
MSAPRSIIYLGAKRIGAECLAWLLQQQEVLGVRVVGVLTNARGEGVRQVAAAAGVPDLGALEALLDHPPVDLLVSVQYHRILKAPHIARGGLAVNLHMAPVPEYRGCNQFSFAIANGDRTFGTTLHMLDTGIDSGDILAERRFPIPEGCFVEELYELTYEHSVALFREAMPEVIAGRATRTPQSVFAGTRRSGYHSRESIAELKALDLDWRATLMPGFPPPWCTVAGRRIEFTLSPDAADA